jgi:hypothetical protein
MSPGMRVENPDDVKVTLTLTFTIRHWKQMRNLLEKDMPGLSWPVSEVRDDICNLVRQVEKHFTPTIPPPAIE